MKLECINLDGKTYTIMLGVTIGLEYEALNIEMAQKDALKVAKEALLFQETTSVDKNRYQLSQYKDKIVTAKTDNGLIITGKLQDLPKCIDYEDIYYKDGDFVLHIALNETMFIHMYQEWKKEIQDLRNANKLLESVRVLP